MTTSTFAISISPAGGKLTTVDSKSRVACSVSRITTEILRHPLNRNPLEAVDKWRCDRRATCQVMTFVLEAPVRGVVPVPLRRHP
jgi:hypothetical protein